MPVTGVLAPPDFHALSLFFIELGGIGGVFLFLPVLPAAFAMTYTLTFFLAAKMLMPCIVTIGPEIISATFTLP